MRSPFWGVPETEAHLLGLVFQFSAFGSGFRFRVQRLGFGVLVFSLEYGAVSVELVFASAEHVSKCLHTLEYVSKKIRAFGTQSREHLGVFSWR